MTQPHRLRALTASAVLAAASLGTAGLTAAGTTAAVTPMAVRAPHADTDPQTGPACTLPDGTTRYYHCYDPAHFLPAYGVDRVHQQGYLGDGQTIVLVDAYGTPTGAQDLAAFAKAFGISGPAKTGGAPDFEEVYPLGHPDYSNANAATSKGLSGPSAAAGWAGEATLDIEWAFAVAPHAHIVLLATPPAETLGVQGLPNLMKAISGEIDRDPAGTVFSMSFGTDEPDFGGAAATQFAKFDKTFAKGVAKGDTFFSSAGDSGTTGALKQAKESRTTTTPAVSYPNVSPYVTSVGGTQLMSGWRWAPTSTVPFTADGHHNPAYFSYVNGPSVEAVWNEPWLPAATGGGVSSVYPRPTWQQGVLPQYGDHRLVPDLAFNATVDGGVDVYETYPASWGQQDGWGVTGGTSAASPEVAALTALAVQARGGQGLGNLNPALYSSAGKSSSDSFADDGTTFRDVVSHQFGPFTIGDNRQYTYDSSGAAVSGPVVGYPTTPGYDLTTGFGSPRGPEYVAALKGVPAGR